MDHRSNGRSNLQAHIQMNPLQQQSSRLTATTQEQQRELARLERSIRLDQPRPDNDRFTNDYVDAPKLPLKKSAKPAPNHGGTHGTVSYLTKDHKIVTDNHKKPFIDTDHFITKQPSWNSNNDSKKPPCAIHGDVTKPQLNLDLVKFKPSQETSPDVSPDVGGIICPDCGQCRCATCNVPRKLPSYWVCGGKYEVSAENLVDQISCLCCVKGLFYHAATNEEQESAADEPCTCFGSRCCQRWALMGLLAVTCLPCLLCYWPCRAVTAVCSKCYANHHQRGCKCSSNSPSPESSPQSSIRPLKKLSPVLPPRSRPGHAHRVVLPNNGGASNGGFFR